MIKNICSAEQFPETALHGAAQNLPAYAPKAHIPPRRCNSVGKSLFCIPVSENDGVLNIRQ